MDSLYQTVVGPSDNDNDSVVGAYNCEGKWG